MRQQSETKMAVHLKSMIKKENMDSKEQQHRLLEFVVICFLVVIFAFIFLKLVIL